MAFIVEQIVISADLVGVCLKKANQQKYVLLALHIKYSVFCLSRSFFIVLLKKMKKHFMRKVTFKVLVDYTHIYLICICNLQETTLARTCFRSCQ